MWYNIRRADIIPAHSDLCVHRTNSGASSILRTHASEMKRRGIGPPVGEKSLQFGERSVNNTELHSGADIPHNGRKVL